MRQFPYATATVWGSLRHLLRFRDNHLTVMLSIKRQAMASQLVESMLCGESLTCGSWRRCDVLSAALVRKAGHPCWRE